MATGTAEGLEPLGTAVGVLLVLVGIASLYGAPSALAAGGPLLVAGKVLGALAAIAIGAGTAWLVRT